MDRLKSFLINATQPVVDSVRMEAIPSSDPAKGYIKCLIPASDKTPHRCMRSREYYRRTTEGFYRLQHFDLEDMFGRRPRPTLRAEIVHVTTVHGQDSRVDTIAVHLINEGQAVARYCGFMCTFPPEVQIVATTVSLSDVTAMNKGEPTVAYADNHGVLHPNGIWTRAGDISLIVPGAQMNLPVRLRLYCEHVAALDSDLAVVLP
jgi:hypothetical protein